MSVGLAASVRPARSTVSDRSFRHAAILVVTDSVSDAVLIKRLLGDAFDNVHTALAEVDPVASFDEAVPDVLVLAFERLEDTLAVCQKLRHKRQGARAHRIIALCTKADLRQAFDASREGLFDDYVLFWPMAQDGLRLHMSIHIALRELARLARAGPQPQEFAQQVEQLAELNRLVEGRIQQASREIVRADALVAGAGATIGAALDDLSQRMQGGEWPELLQETGSGSLIMEFARIKDSVVKPPLHQVRQAMTPLSHWASAFSAEAQPLAHSVRVLTEMARIAKPVVLIVDDNDALRGTLGRILETNDYLVDQAESGVHAINAVRRRRPDVILMDMNMPQMDGLQATQRIKAIPQFADVPIIMVTGVSGGNAVRDSLRAGACDFIVKPVHSAALLQKLAKVIDYRPDGHG